jgi:hypothetical protein
MSARNLEAHLLFVIMRDTLLPSLLNQSFWIERPKAYRSVWVTYHSWLNYLWAFHDYSPATHQARQ